MEDLVSVIMAAYNAEQYIEESIKSVINQTYTKWELIICDDCSTDRTYEICERYRKKDDRIKILKNDINRKQAYTRNQCLKLAIGKYVMILDADDVIEVDKIKIQVSFLKQNIEYGFCCTNVYLFDENKVCGHIIKPMEPTITEILNNKAYVYATMMVYNDILKQINGYTVSSITERGEDFDLICKITSLNVKGSNIQKNLYGYRINQNAYNRRKYKYYIFDYKVRKKWYAHFQISGINKIRKYEPLLKGLIPQKLIRILHRMKFEKS